MAKVVLGSLSGGYGHLDTLNDNFSRLATALENTLSRDGTSPNAMGSVLDMNSNRIINLPAPVDNSDAARYLDVMDAALPAQAGLANYILKTDGSQPVWTNILLMGSGTKTAPAYSFSGDTDMGFFQRVTGYIMVAASGQEVAYFSDPNIAGSKGTINLGGSGGGVLGFSTGLLDAVSPSAFLTIDAANILAQRNGVNAQGFRLYNTFTDASNYEHLNLHWTANVAYIRTGSAGTGVARGLAIGTEGANTLYFQTSSTSRWQVGSSGYLFASADNTYDIGASAANRPRSIYVGTNVVSPMVTVDGGVAYANVSGNASRINYDDTNGILTFAADSSGGNTTIHLRTSEAAGSVLRWQVTNQGHLIAGADNTYDIGASGANRPRTGYFGTSVIANVAWMTGDNTQAYWTNRHSTGGHLFQTNNGAQVQFSITHTASAVNYLMTTGAVTSNWPRIQSQGSDTDIGIYLITKGTGWLSLMTNSGTEQCRVAHTASAVNYLQVTGAATGNSPVLSTQGSDTNIDLALTPKGTGVVKYGTHSAIGAETVTGYITIKDSGGTTRKLAVVS